MTQQELMSWLKAADFTENCNAQLALVIMILADTAVIGDL